MFHAIPTPFPLPRRHHGGDAELSGREDISTPTPDLAESNPINLPDFQATNVLCGEGGDPILNSSTTDAFTTPPHDGHNGELEELLSEWSKSKEILQKSLNIGSDKNPETETQNLQPGCHTPDSSVDSEPDSSDAEFPPSEINDPLQDYNMFMAGIRRLIKTETKLVFEMDSFFEESQVFPIGLDLTYHIPEVVTTKTLRGLKISAPKTFYSSMGPRVFESDDTYDENNMFYNEERNIRNRVLFLLRTIQSFSLQQFAFVNMCGGAKVRNKTRISLWHNALETFLNRHSSTLEHLSVRTMLDYALSISHDAALSEGRNLFPQLEELDIIFWANPQDEENQKYVGDSFLENYWVKLLRSRGEVGHLTRLVWMSPFELFFTEVLLPVLLHNKNSLIILQLLTLTDSQLESNMGMTSSRQDKLYISISCSVFSEMPNLAIFYLRKSSCFLQRLDLLPTSLVELSIDGPFLESSEISTALGKLINLRKLRLLNNNITLLSLQYQAFGVNLNVIKSILSHRKLNSFFIWGYTLKESTEVLSTEVQKPKKITSFQKLLKRWYVQDAAFILHKSNYFGL